MLKMLLVDDEPIAREHIKNYFPWEDWGIVIIGEAANGIEALEFCQEELPDIALIDITMPMMNGLDLLDELKQRYPSMEAIFLTAHRSFDYAQKAIQKGAAGYILKSPINLTETKEIIQKVTQQISQRNNEKTNFIHSPFSLRQTFFLEVINDTFTSNEMLLKEARKRGILLHHSTYYMMLCFINSHRKGFIDEEIFQGMTEYMKKEVSAEFELFPVTSGTYVLLIKNENISHYHMDNLMNCLNKFLFESHDANVSIIRSEKAIEPLHFKSKYNELHQCKQYVFYCNQSVPITIEEIEPASNSSIYLYVNFTLELKKIIESRATEQVDFWVKNVLNTSQQYKPDPNFVKTWLVSLEKIPKETVDDFPDFKNSTHLLDALTQLKEWIKNQLYSNVSHLQMEEVITFIRENIEKELSLNFIAEQFFRSPSYLGEMFKKQMGISITDYIVKERIALAKTLMSETEFRNYEIAEKVGFTSYSYFCTIFKKLENQSPNEFRNN